MHLSQEMLNCKIFIIKDRIIFHIINRTNQYSITQMHKQVATTKGKQTAVSEQNGRGRTHRVRNLSDLTCLNVVPIFNYCDLEDITFFQMPSQLRKDAIAAKFEHSSQALLQIFTYQYLLLCCQQINRSNSKHSAINQTKYLQSLYQLLQKQQFQLMLPPKPHPLSQCSQPALKNILSQFVNYLHQNCTSNCDYEECAIPIFSFSQQLTSILQKYPLIIQIFVSLMRGLLYLGDICEQYEDKLQIQATYDFLASYFGMEASIDPNNSCVCFHHSGVYAWEVGTIVYMICINRNAMGADRNISKKSIGASEKIVNMQGKQYEQSINSSQLCGTNIIIQTNKNITCEVPWIQVEEMSSFQKSKHHPNDSHNMESNENQVTVLVSNIDIQQQQQNHAANSTHLHHNNAGLNFNVNNKTEIVIHNTITSKMQILQSLFDQVMNVKEPIGKKQNYSMRQGFGLQHKFKIADSHIVQPLTTNYNSNQNIHHIAHNTNSSDLQKQKVSSITTTYSSFRKNSLNCKQLIKQYIEKPSILQSQFVQTVHFNELKDNTGFQVYRNHRVKEEQEKLKNYQKYISIQAKENLYGKFGHHPNQQNNQYKTKNYNAFNLQLVTSQIMNLPKKMAKLDQYVETTQTFYVPQHVKARPVTQISKPGVWFNKNISKQFTNSVILDSMPQPFRSNIKATKTRARQIRKNIIEAKRFIA